MILLRSRLNTLSEAEITQLIDTLNPLTLDDPSPKWRQPLEKLRISLLSATKLERNIRSAGPWIAVIAFAVFEWSELSTYAIALLATAAASIAAATFAPVPTMRAAGVGTLGLAGALLYFVVPLHGYLAAATSISAAISLSLERVYPVLNHDDRIIALVRYFEPDLEPADVPSRFF